MNLQERQDEIVRAFSGLASWEDKYKHIIGLGKQLAPYPEEFRTDDWRVKGCQSQVWLHPERDTTGSLQFQAESDAVIVKGLVALVLKVYSNAKPEEILASSPRFIEQIGLSEHLTPSRANGLMAMIKQIKYYAAAYQAMG